jgi:hypothetical protein
MSYYDIIDVKLTQYDIIEEFDYHDDIIVLSIIWNRDRLYEIMDFCTYMYVLVCTEYIPVRNAENGTYRYVIVCTMFEQVIRHV